MYQKEGKEKFYRTVLKMSVGLTNGDDIHDRMHLMDLETPETLSRNDVRDVIAKAIRIMRGLLVAEREKGIVFESDDVLYGKEPHQVIDCMTSDKPWGAVYFGRRVVFSGGKPELVYARASWNFNQGQFTSGNWWANGRSYGSFCYVSSWQEYI